jgi:hypothetical protein
MPPGAEATGHFRENTAILSLAGGGLDAENGRWFHENSMSRRSPEKPSALARREAAPARAGEQEEERWRRRREKKGRSRMRERRDGERESIGWGGHRCFLGLGGEASSAIDHAASELARARRAWTGAHAVSEMAPRRDRARREMGRILGAVQNSTQLLEEEQWGWSDLQAFDLHLGAC